MAADQPRPGSTVDPGESPDDHHPVPDEDGPHDVPDEKVIDKTLPTAPVPDKGGSASPKARS
jgi:hypothetical protein